jgi:hypothetical protein
MEYPALDREAARRDPRFLDRWEERVDLLYKVELSELDLRFSPQDDIGLDNALTEWERAARGDREWAAGYRRGLADSLVEESDRRGPGVMPLDPKDGWSPSLERRAGYDDGLLDGSKRGTP